MADKAFCPKRTTSDAHVLLRYFFGLVVDINSYTTLAVKSISHRV